MHVFPATFKSHGNRLGSQTIVFEVDDLNNEMIKDLATSPQGKPFVVVAIEIEQGEDPMGDLLRGDVKIGNNFMKQIHARVGEYEEQTGVKADEIKRLLKVKMKSRGIDKKSLSEYSDTELSTAVFVLNTELSPSRFNYRDYIKK